MSTQINSLVMCHGGAQTYPPQDKVTAVAGCIEAVNIGMDILKSGKSGVDSVVETVKSLENNQIFNSGFGACLNEIGGIELDSLVIDGSTMDYGAIIGANNIFNPVGLAKEVMYQTPHCILSGQGISEFAKKINYRICEDVNQLICKRSRKQWQDNPNFISSLKAEMSSDALAVKHIDHKCQTSHDTVGAVVLTESGHLACATSTGGINGKMLGRAGDSAIIGCGGYANHFGAAVATGHGESFLKTLATYKTVSYMERGYDPSRAAEKVLSDIKTRFSSCGGIICINNRGEYGSSYTTEDFPWAMVDSKGKITTSD